MSLGESLRQILDPQMLRYWVFTAIKVIVVALAFEIAVLIVHRAIDRALLSQVATRGAADAQSRLRRRRTLRSVARSASKYLLYFIGFVVIVNMVGWGKYLAPILGAGAVLGLAVGIGAQQVMRDALNGFFILLEDQYDVGDVVTIAGVTGTVEELGIRITRVREEAGRLHLIANGSINQVANHSR